MRKVEFVQSYEEWFEEKVNEFTTDKMVSVLNNVVGEDYGSFDDYFFKERYTSGIDIVRATVFGKVDFTHEYIHIDDYGNLESLSDSDMRSVFESNIDDVRKHLQKGDVEEGLTYADYVSDVVLDDSVLYVYEDWNCEGAIRMINQNTINRYLELKEGIHDIEWSSIGLFAAFNDEQFEEGKKSILDSGAWDGEQKLVSVGSGVFGTEGGFKKYFEIIDGEHGKIAEECDPQEVYFYEYNNYECMLSYDGDEDAIKVVSEMFGKTVANSICRNRAICGIN